MSEYVNTPTLRSFIAPLLNALAKANDVKKSDMRELFRSASEGNDDDRNTIKRHLIIYVYGRDIVENPADIAAGVRGFDKIVNSDFLNEEVYTAYKDRGILPGIGKRYVNIEQLKLIIYVMFSRYVLGETGHTNTAVVGTGKTFLSISMLAWALKYKICKDYLIIAPKAVLQTWANNLTKALKGIDGAPPVSIVQSKQGKTPANVINIESFVNREEYTTGDKKSRKLSRAMRKRIKSGKLFFFIDEAHNIINKNTVSYSACEPLISAINADAERGNIFMQMSGTLWCNVKGMCTTLRSYNISDAKSSYVYPTDMKQKNDGRTKYSILELRDRVKKYWPELVKAIIEVDKKYRKKNRTKKVVEANAIIGYVGLYFINVHDINPIGMFTPDRVRYYNTVITNNPKGPEFIKFQEKRDRCIREFTKDVQNKLDGETPVDSNSLTIMGLIANFDILHNFCAAIGDLREVDANGVPTMKKVIIGVPRIQTINLLEEMFEAYGYKVLVVSGPITSEEREEICSKFNRDDDRYRVFICTDTIAVGISLGRIPGLETIAEGTRQRVPYSYPCYNLRVSIQFNGRGHRPADDPLNKFHNFTRIRTLYPRPSTNTKESGGLYLVELFNSLRDKSKCLEVCAIYDPVVPSNYETEEIQVDFDVLSEVYKGKKLVKLLKRITSPDADSDKKRGRPKKIAQESEPLSVELCEGVTRRMVNRKLIFTVNGKDYDAVQSMDRDIARLIYKPANSSKAESSSTTSRRKKPAESESDLSNSDTSDSDLSSSDSEGEVIPKKSAKSSKKSSKSSKKSSSSKKPVESDSESELSASDSDSDDTNSEVSDSDNSDSDSDNESETE